MRTDKLYLTDAYLRRCTATVVDADAQGGRVALDRTVLYATGGGQPHDRGTLRWAGDGAPVASVRSEDELVWHELAGGAPLPAPGTEVEVELDWDRRHALMRTHSALHVLCGVIWHTYGVAVTGGNMEPGSARMDFEFDPLPAGFAARVQERMDEEVAADRPIEVSFLPRAGALADADLIRTKIDRVPSDVEVVRVVDIVGLDRQADGGTHVRRTGEIGRIVVVKTESKGKAFKRVRLAVTDRNAEEGQ
jgi:misacylated tRNA(Ala) deacylase